MRWIAAHRVALAMIPLAALGGLAAGLAVAPDGSKSGAATRTITLARINTVVVRRTITKPGAAATTTVIEPAPAGARVAKDLPAAPPSRATAANRNFAGNGPRYLGDVTVKSTGTVHWRSTGTRFRLLFGGGIPAVDTTDHSGETFVPAGTYYQVRVQTDGNWTMSIG